METELTLAELEELDRLVLAAASANADKSVSHELVMAYASRVKYAVLDAAPRLLAMARELIRLRGAWHHLEDVNKIKRGSLLRRAIELGWVDPLSAPASPEAELKGGEG